jgi:hypothetical protein
MFCIYIYSNFRSFFLVMLLSVYFFPTILQKHSNKPSNQQPNSLYIKLKIKKNWKQKKYNCRLLVFLLQVLCANILWDYDTSASLLGGRIERDNNICNNDNYKGSAINYNTTNDDSFGDHIVMRLLGGFTKVLCVIMIRFYLYNNKKYGNKSWCK